MTSGAGLRIGIDVGGTFTDAVALDAATGALRAFVKVPTTHASARGVADGITHALDRLFRDHSLDPRSVRFIAHATTQATNALLEGDLARVGIVGIAGALAPLARQQLRLAPFRLDGGVRFAVETAYARAGDVASVERALDVLSARGVQAIVATAPFGVDDPNEEDRVVALARRRGLPAVAAHEIAQTYGLRTRTRTAAVNAAILPAMMQTARTTAGAAARAGIAVPLMVMRSDGGVMDLADVERRPILTVLSGPAAGVAGALLHDHASDAIFVEVGGTSSDLSAIRSGRPQMRRATVGGRPTTLWTLDVRTLAVAGGSMVRGGYRGITGVGPRSAHIAGCAYAAFSTPESLENARVRTLDGDFSTGDGYLVLETPAGSRIALTPTCAANALEAIPPQAFGYGSPPAARRAFEILGKALHADPLDCARRVLECAAFAIATHAERLVREYALDRSVVTLIGGGGGARAIVPHAAQRLGVPWRMARDAEVISPVGVALALIRDAVERTAVDPPPDELARLRREVADRVVAMGADPQTIEVTVEIDPRANRLRAAASGAAALGSGAAQRTLDVRAIREIAMQALGAGGSDAVEIARTDGLSVFRAAGGDGSGGICVVDDRGVVRLRAQRALVLRTDARHAIAALRAALERAARYGDAGRTLPGIAVLHGGRMAEFDGFLDTERLAALVREELGGRDDAAPVAIVAVPRDG